MAVGKDEVIGSNPIISSMKILVISGLRGFFYFYSMPGFLCLASNLAIVRYRSHS